MVKVSVIVAAWRAADTVGRAIASARAQSLTDIEIIVVNDASPDETSAAVRLAAGGDARVRLIELAVNGGPAAARNAGFDAARGEWVAVLDADDAMAPERLERLIGFAERQGAVIVADDLLLLAADGAATGKRHLGLTRALQVDLAAYADANHMFAAAAPLGYLKPLFRADFLNRHGLRYDRRVRIGEDYQLVADALAHGAAFALCPLALYHYTSHAGSISHRLSRADLGALIAADDRFMAQHARALTPDARAALRRRRASLDDADAFVAAVDALKARDLGATAAALLRRPAAVRHFAMPIGARIARLGGRSRGAGA